MHRSRRLLSCTRARSVPSSRSSTGTSTSRNWNSTSARPGMMEGAPGSSAMRPVVQVVRSPQTRGNSRSIAASRRTAARPGVAPLGHGGAAGVVLLPLDRDAPLPDGDDARDHAEPLPRALELRALLDVHLEEAAVAAGVQGEARQAGEPGGGEGVAQRRAVVAAAAAVDLLLGERADGGAAAEEAALEMPFLVGEGDDVHGRPARASASPATTPSAPSSHPA